VNLGLHNSTVLGSSSHGVNTITAAGKAPITLTVDGSRIAGNAGSGIQAVAVAASGKGSTVVRVGNSTITQNLTGVSTSGPAVIQSCKNNQTAGNLTDGTPITAFPGPGGTPLQ